MKKPPKTSKRLQRITAYAVPKHPADGHTLDLFLDGNEGLRPPAALLQSLHADLSEKLRRYPKQDDLAEALAIQLSSEGARVAPENILITAGADEGIERVCKAYLSENCSILLPVPTFEMIGRYVALTGASITEIPWESTTYPVERVVKKISKRVAAIAVVSPNNPTGCVIPAAGLKRLSQKAPRAIIMLDAAYGEFAAEDLTATVLGLPNVVMLRTFSKAYGMAGIRVGYMVARKEIISELKKAGGPYAVSKLSMMLAKAALETCKSRMHEFVSQVKIERGSLNLCLQEFGLKPYPSEGNFVFCHFKNALWLRDQLAGFGISVRAFPKDRLLKKALRITCPGHVGEFTRLQNALRIALAPQAMLFDLDGVIADVSQSYRQAILQTAQFFGAPAKAQDIAEEKAKGDANNDWEVTMRIIKKYGVDKSFNDIKNKFEALYQGDQSRRGLKEKEKLLVKKSFFAALAKRLPLGIVTGRPAKDADYFLKEHGIREFFKTVVCMEDAALKPAPDAILLAMKKMNIQRAWYLGDTPDDMVAARGAGALPIGVLNSYDPSKNLETVLYQNGAGRVLKNLSQLEGLIP